MPALLRSPLHERHVAAGAKLSDFGGWLMPIEYPVAGGVVKEHLAVRGQVGVFDVSHLGKATVRGAGARSFVNECLTNDLTRIEPGQAQYTLCCAGDGGVVDDLIAYLVSDDEVFLVPNAANTAEVVGRLEQAAGAGRPAGIEVIGQHQDFGVIAVQGPRSPDVLQAIGLPADLPYMAYVDTAHDGRPLRICRTGYTGEHGYELIPAWADAGALWDALLAAAEALGGRPAGLGARDTLRTEAGYPLHGQDLAPDITPVQARCGWAVGWAKHRFWGREALVAEREAGPARLLWGVEVVDRGIPRPHMQLRDSSGAVIGHLTSGTFSPTLRKGIGLALIDASSGVAAGHEVSVDIRGRLSTAVIRKPPFVPLNVR